jgi:hypothetical protein
MSEDLCVCGERLEGAREGPFDFWIGRYCRSCGFWLAANMGWSLERLKAALSALAPTVEGAGVGHTECICVPGTEGGIDPACVACFGDVMEEQDRRERRRNR